MFWDDDSDSEGWQMLKNWSFLNMPLNNKDRDEMMPVFGIIMLTIIALGALAGIGYLIFGK